VVDALRKQMRPFFLIEGCTVTGFSLQKLDSQLQVFFAFFCAPDHAWQTHLYVPFAPALRLALETV
jgi:hypothetical protein